ncbi:MAG TPA: hypothetical protein VFS21_04575, partial [Roseiflexaceae bacterium]|nr:hypothetical protein [Roseiflexaceae bacterium]
PAEVAIEHAAPALEGEAASVEAMPLVEPVLPARSRRKIVRASAAERAGAGATEAAPIVEGEEAASTSDTAVTPAEETAPAQLVADDEEEASRNEGAAPPASETDESTPGEITP